MKNTVCATMALCLVGCGNSGTQFSQNGSATAVSTADLLQKGSASACSQADVRDTVLSNVKPTGAQRGPEELTDFQNGLANLSYNIDNIALAGVDASIKSVSCDANLTIHFRDHDDKSFSIRYVIRPSIENSTSAIINTIADDARAYAANAAQASAGALRATREQAAAAKSVPQEEIQADGSSNVAIKLIAGVNSAWGDHVPTDAECDATPYGPVWKDNANIADTEEHGKNRCVDFN